MDLSAQFKLLVSSKGWPKQAIDAAEIKAWGCLLVTPVSYAMARGELGILFVLRRNELFNPQTSSKYTSALMQPCGTYCYFSDRKVADRDRRLPEHPEKQSASCYC